MSLEIQLNSNILPLSSQEYLAETIFHEMLHAQFNHDSTAKSQYTQHMYVAQSWISTECTALTTMFPTLTPKYANALILSGLSQINDKNPTYFASLISSYNLTTNDIITIVSGYKNNDLGTGCLGAKVK